MYVVCVSRLYCNNVLKIIMKKKRIDSCYIEKILLLHIDDRNVVYNK